MVEALNATGRYVVTPKVESKPGPLAFRSPCEYVVIHITEVGARPKDVFHQCHDLGARPKEKPPYIDNSNDNFGMKQPPFVPKISPFSGDDPPQKGDATFTEWRFVVQCLVIDPDMNTHGVL